MIIFTFGVMYFLGILEFISTFRSIVYFTSGSRRVVITESHVFYLVVAEVFRSAVMLMVWDGICGALILYGRICNLVYYVF